MEEKGLIIRKPNPDDGRGVLIYLTRLGKEKRAISKGVVLKFNNTVKKHIHEKELQVFYDVAQSINDLISEKKYNN